LSHGEIEDKRIVMFQLDLKSMDIQTLKNSKEAFGKEIKLPSIGFNHKKENGLMVLNSQAT